MQANNLRLKKCDCTDFIDWLIENCTQCNGTIGLIRVDHIDDGLEEKKVLTPLLRFFCWLGRKVVWKDRIQDTTPHLFPILVGTAGNLLLAFKDWATVISPHISKNLHTSMKF